MKGGGLVVGCWRRIFDRSFDETFHSFGSAQHCGDVSVCLDIDRKRWRGECIASRCRIASD